MSLYMYIFHRAENALLNGKESTRNLRTTVDRLEATREQYSCTVSESLGCVHGSITFTVVIHGGIRISPHPSFYFISRTNLSLVIS
jgi:hypothetical protein